MANSFHMRTVVATASISKLSNDKINEAVSSLVFASASCGQELRELVSIKELFSQRYGQSYVTSALQLRPGNLVNLQIKENLSESSVSEDVKFRLLDEIAKDYVHRLEVLRLKYTSEIGKQKEEKEKKVMDSDLHSCSDEQSPDEVYKSSLSDFEEEISEEETSVLEDDYIEEAQTQKRTHQRRRRSSKKEGQEDRQKAVTNQDVHHPDYDQMKNQIKAVKAKEEEELLVQPRLPDEDQMVNQIKAVKAKDEEQRRLATRHVHPKLPD
ncbi:PREDICTED: uncharacterized protein LOC109129974 [Camelina sativa]|uniref:Uncharacterized protein LOC109129974 n=1 Tax=Camelina sativa TaxID=90675 RepID=A0ABM1R6E6_CAMSA|nr:PREDICTED: uncharacterized protein LOC109129974 [Camelina sativa]